MITLRGGADIETGDIVLIGDSVAFRRLAALLKTPEPAMIELEPLTDRPAISPIEVLRLEQAEGAATLRLLGDVAMLSGEPEGLARLADEIELFLEYNDLSEPGMHSHIDSSSISTGKRLLAADSRGLVLAGPIRDDRM